MYQPMTSHYIVKHLVWNIENNFPSNRWIGRWRHTIQYRHLVWNFENNFSIDRCIGRWRHTTQYKLLVWTIKNKFSSDRCIGRWRHTLKYRHPICNIKKISLSTNASVDDVKLYSIDIDNQLKKIIRASKNEQGVVVPITKNISDGNLHKILLTQTQIYRITKA